MNGRIDRPFDLGGQRMTCVCYRLLAGTWIGLAAFALCLLLPKGGVGEELELWRWRQEDGTRIELRGHLESIRNGLATIAAEDNVRHKVTLERLEPGDRKRALIARIGSGVVQLSSQGGMGQNLGMGSGFVVSDTSRLIVTNFHVVQGAYRIDVKFRDTSEAAQVTACAAVDYGNDLALLQVDRLPEGVHVLEVARQSELEIGSDVWAIGHPEGLINTVSWGQVNAFRRTRDLPDELQQELDAPAETRWLQTDAVVAHGSSGGPLLDPQGTVVGVNTFLVGPNLAFAVGSDRVLQLAALRKKTAPLALPVPPGPAQRVVEWMCPETLKIVTELGERLAEARESSRNQASFAARSAKLKGPCRQQLLELAHLRPRGWAGMQAAVLACGMWEPNSPDADDAIKDACRLAYRHHRDSPWMKDLFQMLIPVTSQPSGKFLRFMHERTPDEELAQAAGVALVMNQIRALQQDRLLPANEIAQFRDAAHSAIQQLKQRLAADEEATAAVDFFQQLLDNTIIGNPPLETAGVDIEGNRFDLEEYKGKVILLDFFADYCPHCKVMYPHERQMTAEFADRPFVLLGVHCENQQVLDRLLREETVTWRCWADGQNGPNARRWRIEGIPTVVLIDCDWIVRRVFVGTPGTDVLRRDVEQLLAEAEMSSSGK